MVAGLAAAKSTKLVLCEADKLDFRYHRCPLRSAMGRSGNATDLTLVPVRPSAVTSSTIPANMMLRKIRSIDFQLKHVLAVPAF
jgi:hypothetical protein